MKRILDNAGLMQKIVATILLLATVALGVMGFSTYEMLQIDGRYEVLSSQQSGTFKLARANRIATEMPLAGYQVLTYGAGSTRGSSARQRLDESRQKAIDALREAADFDASLGNEVSKVSADVEGIYRNTLEAIRWIEAGQSEQAHKSLDLANSVLDTMGAHLITLNNKRTAAAQAEVDSLSVDTQQIMTWSLVIGTAASLIAAAIGFYIAKFGIVGPLLAVEGRLREVAAGNVHVEVPCTERQDEVGRMCRAVQVLRDANIDRDRLTREKERADAEQKTVVHTLSRNLDQLAEGNLTAEITEEFTGD